MRFSVIYTELKSPNEAEAHLVRVITEKAQALLNGACFLEISSREIQRDGILLTLLLLEETRYRWGLATSCHAFFAFLC